MSLNALTLELIFTGEDRTGNAVQSLERSILDLKSAADQGSTSLDDQTSALIRSAQATRGTQRIQSLLRREMYQENEQFFMGTKIIGGFGNAALKVNSIMTGFNVLQIRGEQLAENEAEAWERLQDALKSGNMERITKAQKELNRAQREQQEYQRQLPFQYLAQGTAALSLAEDIGKLALETKLFFKYRSLGLFSNGAGFAGGYGGPGALSGLGGMPMGGGIGGRGIRGFLGSWKGAAAIGTGLIGAGLAAEAALTPENQKSATDKLLSTLGQAGSFAATGTLIGSVIPGLGTLIGAGVGGGAGLALGLATNYGEEFSNLFAGKGFVTNSDLGGSAPGAPGGMNVNGPVYVVVNRATPAEVQAGIEDWAGTYR